MEDAIKKRRCFFCNDKDDPDNPLSDFNYGYQAIVGEKLRTITSCEECLYDAIKSHAQDFQRGFLKCDDVDYKTQEEEESSESCETDEEMSGSYVMKNKSII